jgi:hypothetical protein
MSLAYVTKSQLKAILRLVSCLLGVLHMLICKKILDGIEYLALIGLEHSLIKCINILIGTLGSIRIGWF